MSELRDTKTLTGYRAAGGDSDSRVNQSICADLVRRDIKLCCSMLVDSLVKASSSDTLGALDIQFEDLAQVMSQPDYEQAVLEWIEDDASIDDLVEAGLIEKPKGDEDDVQIENAGDNLRKVAADNARGMTAEQHQGLYTDHDIVSTSSTEDIEALEHWVVDSHFGGKLGEFGEMVSSDIFPDGWTVWGRATSGQSIYMDSVIKAVACDMQILDGQKYSWAD